MRFVISCMLVFVGSHAIASPVTLSCLITPDTEDTQATPSVVSLIIDQDALSARLNPGYFHKDWHVLSMNDQNINLSAEAEMPDSSVGSVFMTIDRYTGSFRMRPSNFPSVVGFKGQCTSAERRF